MKENSIEENIERIAKLITTKFNNDYSIDNVDKEAIEELLKAYKELKEIEESHRKENGELREKVKQLEEDNKRLKASHIVTHNKISDEEKAEIFDVIDNSIDTYFEKIKPYWGQIMTKDKMSLEEAETIINDMYQDRNKILENNNVIDISRLDDVKFTNLEFASVRAIREIQSLERKLENSIPVSLVEEKIGELNKQLEEDLQDEIKVNSNRFIIICQCKSCLQELLEGRKI